MEESEDDSESVDSEEEASLLEEPEDRIAPLMPIGDDSSSGGTTFHPVLPGRPTPDVPRLPHSDPQPQPQPQPTPVTPSTPAVQGDLLSQIQSIITSAISGVETRMRSEFGGQGPLPSGPKFSAKDLPRCSADNPWRYCQFAPLVGDDSIFLEGLGNRLVSDLEFFPNYQAYPECWARLKDGAVREDTIPKETILYDFQKAQDFTVRVIKAVGGENTGVTAFDKKKATFLANKEQAFCFASKGFDALQRAWLEDKPCPSLEECRPTSLLLPQDGNRWQDVQHTFASCKLASDCAQKQFQERLPLLSDVLIKKELEARERLAASMHHQCMLEASISTYKENEIFKVLAKSHLGTFNKDLHAFAMVRRECRRFVLRFAKVRHEPNRLIDSRIWGKNLFPDDIVEEIMAKAAQENRNLLDKWDAGFQGKRKSSPGQGPQPKRLKKSKGKQGRFPTQPPQPAYQPPQQPPPSTSLHPTAAPLFPSPAYNPGYERSHLQSSHYAQDYGIPGFVPNRGGNFRGRGRGRGKGSRGGKRGGNK